jgi:hypothetical protein
LREFELSNPNGVLTAENDLASVVEAIRLFLHQKYLATIVPAIQAAGQDFDEALQNGTASALGIVIGGYSTGEFLPELWHMLIPYNRDPNSAQQRFERGRLGTSWYSMFEPIVRYINGLDQQILNELGVLLARTHSAVNRCSLRFHNDDCLRVEANTRFAEQWPFEHLTT